MIYTVTFNPAIDYIVHTGTMQVGQLAGRGTVFRRKGHQCFVRPARTGLALQGTGLCGRVYRSSH